MRPAETCAYCAARAGRCCVATSARRRSTSIASRNTRPSKVSSLALIVTARCARRSRRCGMALSRLRGGYQARRRRRDLVQGMCGAAANAAEHVQFGVHRWWPAQVLRDEDMPENLHRGSRTFGCSEPGPCRADCFLTDFFPISFFGGNDYAWIQHCSVVRNSGMRRVH